MKQAVILAAGEGQRLRPFTVTRPKVMISIAGKPVIQYVIEALAANGILDIVIVVGYHREQIFDYINTGEQFGVHITYVTQERQLGTAHALQQVKDVVNEQFMLLPGDNLIEPATIRELVNLEPDAMLVKKVGNASRYGVVTIEGGMVKGMVEKPGDGGSGIVNTGIYVLSRQIFEAIENQLDIPDILNSLVERGRSIRALESDGAWLDIVYPWDILSLNDAVLRGLPARLGGTVEAGTELRGMVSVGRESVIRSGSYITGPVIIGEHCDIGPNVCIRPATSIGHNVVIAPFSVIENSVIGDDTVIGPASLVQDSVIDKGCIIKAHLSACSGAADIKINDEYQQVITGAMLGVRCVIGSSVVAQPGTIIGNYSQVQPMKVLSGRLPDRSCVV